MNCSFYTPGTIYLKGKLGICRNSSLFSGLWFQNERSIIYEISETKTGIFLGLGAGYKFLNHWRLEAEYIKIPQILESHTNSGVHVNSVRFNFIYDL